MNTTLLPHKPQHLHHPSTAATSSTNFYHLIDCLPLGSIEYAFAYGSGAISQAEEDPEDKMVDFILVSSDSLSFHRENLQRNRHHYSFLKTVFQWSNAPAKIQLIQNKFAARIYINTLIRSRDRQIKYGIIDLEDFQSDLLDWNWLYVAGRLHKPVVEVIPPREGNKPDGPIRSALLENQRIALDTALLQLPDEFKLDQLLHKIVSLSYVGDIRTLIGEDRRKVEKLVRGALSQLTAIYLPLLSRDSRVDVTNTARILQDGSTPAIYHRLNLLPFGVQTELYNDYHNRILTDKKQRDIEEVMFALAHRHDIPQRVANAVEQIVRRSSRHQMIKNALTAGLMKSIMYSGKKVSKMLRSIR